MQDAGRLSLPARPDSCNAKFTRDLTQKYLAQQKENLAQPFRYGEYLVVALN
jgi:hypothetical protein